MTQDQAETIALQALGWIASSDDLLDVFMGATGSGRDELRARAQETEFLAAVLDFLVMDDKWVTGFCDATGVPYDTPMRARAALPGGEQVHWT